MCHYCGCREMPLIRDYVAEHERATDLGDTAVRAIDHGDLDKARRSLVQMAVELASHWDGEENGIFRAMQTDPLYAAYIAPLVVEHRQLADLLATVDVADPEDQQRIRIAVFELREHIQKEEDGLFPASLTAMSGADWDASIEAWHAAHPGDSRSAPGDHRP
jgi:iron-sulfur cluster repair protein YtfE (RIC family)